MYREKSWNRLKRKREKERKAAQWYRDGQSDRYDFPIFCPCTPNGELLNRWRNIADDIKRQSKDRIRPKIIEQYGTSLKSILPLQAITQREQSQ